MQMVVGFGLTIAIFTSMYSSSSETAIAPFLYLYNPPIEIILPESY